MAKLGGSGWWKADIAQTRYKDKLKEKEGQHLMLQTALEDHGYQVLTFRLIPGVSGSHFHTTTQAFKQLGLSHDAAKTLLLKLHEHSITCLPNIVTSRRVLESEGRLTPFLCQAFC